MDTLELLATNEERISELYLAYSKRFTAYKTLWATMSEEEKQHAVWIRELDAEVRKNTITLDEKRFPVQAIERYGTYLNTELARLPEQDYSPIEALSVAHHIEQSLIERKYFEVIKGDTKLLREVMSKLEKSTKAHLARIQNAGGRPLT